MSLHSLAIPESSDLAPTSERWLRDSSAGLSKNDQFGVTNLSSQMTSLLAHADPPFAVSLSGAWGVGKSTIADDIADRLFNQFGIRTVKIDAWTLDVTQLRRTLVIEVGAALRGNRNKDREDIAEELDDVRTTRTQAQSPHLEIRKRAEIGKLLNSAPIPYLIIVAAIVACLLGVSFLKPDNGIRAVLINLLSSLVPIVGLGLLYKLVTPSETRAPASEEIATNNKFNELVTGTPKDASYNKPIVVMVDNLDRLSGEDALSVLKQMRSLIDVPKSRCVFFVPIDRIRLETHISQSLHDSHAAADYLDKFFHLDVQLAHPEPTDLHNWAFQQAQPLFPRAPEKELRSISTIVVAASGPSPRTVVRLLNGIFTRCKILASEPQYLDQLALLEGIISICPNLLRLLVEEPRRFVALRERLQIDTDTKLKPNLIVECLVPQSNGWDETDTEKVISHLDAERLWGFLLATRDIPLTTEYIRLALTLREDRFWKGVTYAHSLRTALEAGDAQAISDALSGEDEVDRNLGLERCVKHIENSVDYPRTVARGLDSLAESIPHGTDLSIRLHSTTIKVLSQADLELIRSLSIASLGFLITQRESSVWQPLLRRSIVDAIDSFGSTDALMWALRVVAPSLEFPDLIRVRKKIAEEPPQAQAAVFEVPPSLLLAEGPVAEKLFASLSTWDGQSGDEQVLLASTRLDLLADAGWLDETKVRSLAASMEGIAQTLTIGGLPIFDSVLGLMERCQPGDEFDSLATILATRSTVGGAQLFTRVFRLPLRPTTLENSVGPMFRSWLESTEPEAVESALQEIARYKAVRALPDLNAILLNRWEVQGDERFASLATVEGIHDLSALQSKWGALPDSIALSRLLGVFSVTESVGKRDAVEQFLPLAVDRIALMPVAALGDIPMVLDWLKRRNYEREGLVRAFADRISNARGPELLAIRVPTLSSEPFLGANQAAKLAEALSSRFIDENIGECGDVRWLVRHLASRDARERLLVQLVERQQDPQETIEVVSSSHREGFTSERVCEALLQRASSESVEATASAFIEEAQSWTSVKFGHDSEVRGFVDAIALKFELLSSIAHGFLTTDEG